jgi:hypothetical protein
VLVRELSRLLGRWVGLVCRGLFAGALAVALGAGWTAAALLAGLAVVMSLR